MSSGMSVEKGCLKLRFCTEPIAAFVAGARAARQASIGCSSRAARAASNT